MRFPGLNNPLESVLSYIANDPQIDPRTGEPVPYTGLGGKTALIQALQGLNPIPQVEDAYGAIRHPIRRLQEPGGTMAYPLMGRYAPKTPGLRAEALARGDETKMLGGLPDPRTGDLPVFDATVPSRLRDKAGWAKSRNAERYYHLKNAADEIVGIATREKYPAGRKQSGSAFVPSMWVDPRYRNTTAMMDLYNLVSRGGKTPIRATFANERLEKVFNKRMERAGKTNDLKESFLQHVTPERRAELTAPPARPRRNETPDMFQQLAEIDPAASQRVANLEHQIQQNLSNRTHRESLPNPSLSKPASRNDTIALALALKMEREGRRLRPGIPLKHAQALVNAQHRVSTGRRGGV